VTFKDEPRATVSAGNNSLQTVITGPRHIGPGALSFPRVPRLIGKQLPSIRTFKIFLAVVKYGTFAAAGDEVGLTAAAVGSNIRGMEEEMKVRFFERSGRAVTLNAAGRRAVPQIEELVLRYEGLLGSSGTGPTAGQLVMGAMVSSVRNIRGRTLGLAHEFADARRSPDRRTIQ
jgi:hypothetical protein